MSSFSVWILIADWALRLALVARVILRTCPVPISLAWILAILLMPVPFVGAALYLLVGESRLATHRAFKHGSVSRTMEQLTHPLLQSRADDRDLKEDFFNHIARLATAVGGLPPLRGNHLELIGDASAVLDRLISDIDNAKHHCHCLYYIWMPTNRGVAVAQALIRAAQRGVQCRVLVDSVGSRPLLMSDLVDRMLEAGVKVTAALPVNPLRILIARLDLRNHRKISIIDGTIAYCGSQNLTDETFRNKHRKKIGPWIDATVRIQGPAAQALQSIFLSDWTFDSDEQLPDLTTFFPRITEPTGGSIVQVVPSGPGPQPDAIHQAMLTMIFAAREEIIMTTPYFVPDEAAKNALINAALRGVEVTVIVPDRLDARVVAAASRAHYQELLDAGVRIFEHTDGLLHAKTASIDRKLAFVSSANFDMRSFWLNFEATLFIYDDEFASLLRFMQMGYLAESQPVHPRAWCKRPWPHRFIENVAQLLGPLL